MKYPTLRFVFDRRKVATDTRKASIYLEVAFERKRRDVPTGVHVCVNQWSDSKRVIARTDAPDLNAQLGAIESHVRKVLAAMQDNNEEFTFDKFDVYMKGTTNAGSFIDFLFDRIGKRRLKESTRRQHFVVYNLLVKFDKIKTFADLSPAMLKAFDDFIKEDNKERTQVTIHGIHKRLKPYVNEAYELGYIKENPYAKFKVLRGKSKDREFLNMTEINAIKNKQGLNDCLCRVRDLFLFGCFTGLAFSDVKDLSPEHLVKDNKGELWIRKNRQKTKIMCNIPVLPVAASILEKYKNVAECTGKLLPVLSNQRMNSYLKEIADVCGLQKNLCTHLARHSYATSICLANGVSMENVAKMLGHADTSVTKHYARVLDQNIFKDMQKVNSCLSELAI